MFKTNALNLILIITTNIMNSNLTFISLLLFTRLEMKFFFNFIFVSEGNTDGQWVTPNTIRICVNRCKMSACE
jgi:hypothetical protein